MPWLRHFALFVVLVTALLRPAAAGAFVSSAVAIPHARVGAFELVAATLVGPAAEQRPGLHEGIGATYDENASGYRFAAGGAFPRGGTYVLRDPATGQVMRTGRTGDLVRREAEHARDPALRDLKFDVAHRTDGYVEQRGLEQMLHEAHQPPLNKIRPISQQNPKLQEPRSRGSDRRLQPEFCEWAILALLMEPGRSLKPAGWPEQLRSLLRPCSGLPWRPLWRVGR